jgi:hypothetical protein
MTLIYTQKWTTMDENVSNVRIFGYHEYDQSYIPTIIFFPVIVVIIVLMCKDLLHTCKNPS